MSPAPKQTRSDAARAAYAASRREPGASASAYLWAYVIIECRRDIGGPEKELARSRAVAAIAHAPAPVDAARDVVATFLSGPIAKAELTTSAEAVAALETTSLDDSGTTDTEAPGGLARFPVPGQYDDTKPQRVDDAKLRPEGEQGRTIRETELAAEVLAEAVRRRAALAVVAAEARSSVRALAFKHLTKHRPTALRLDGIASALHEASLAAGTAALPRSAEDNELVDNLMADGADSATVNKALALSCDYETAARTGFRGTRESFVRIGLRHFKEPRA